MFTWKPHNRRNRLQKVQQRAAAGRGKDAFKRVVGICIGGCLFLSPLASPVLGSETWEVAIPVVDMSDDTVETVANFAPVIRRQPEGSNRLDERSAEGRENEDGVGGRSEAASPIPQTTNLAPVIRSKRDSARPVEASPAAPVAAKPIRHLPPVIKRAPHTTTRSATNEGREAVREQVAAVPYGSSSSMEPVMVDLTQSRPPAPPSIPGLHRQPSLLAKPIGDSESGIAAELAILAEPRTGAFREDGNGRLQRLHRANAWNDGVRNQATPQGSLTPTEWVAGKDMISPLEAVPEVNLQPTPAYPAQVAQAPTATQPLPTQVPDVETVPPSTIREAVPTSREDFRPIGQLGVNILPQGGDLPENRAAAEFAAAGTTVHVMGYSRPEPETHFEWTAPALCHRPLFFEDVNLERHGYHVKYAQPIISAAHFFGRLPALPYLHVSQRSRVCNYTLGHYRPGSAAPYVWYYPRPSLTGTALEGAVAVGLALAIP